MRERRAADVGLPLGILETVLVELQRPRVLGDGADDVVGEPVLRSRRDLDSHLHFHRRPYRTPAGLVEVGGRRGNLSVGPGRTCPLPGAWADPPVAAPFACHIHTTDRTRMPVGRHATKVPLAHHSNAADEGSGPWGHRRLIMGSLSARSDVSRTRSARSVRVARAPQGKRHTIRGRRRRRPVVTRLRFAPEPSSGSRPEIIAGSEQRRPLAGRPSPQRSRSAVPVDAVRGPYDPGELARAKAFERSRVGPVPSPRLICARFVSRLKRGLRRSRKPLL